MTDAAQTPPGAPRDDAPLRFLPLGTDGVLVEAAGPHEALALFSTLVAEPLGGVTDVVPGERTVALRFLDSLLTAETLVTVVRRTRVRHDPARDGRLVVLPVEHDTAVLERVAEAAASEPDALLARHLGTTYAVATTSDEPGTAHLLCTDPLLTGLPAPDGDAVADADDEGADGRGTVAVVDGHLVVRPGAPHPGDVVLARTDVALWDLRRRVPAALQPGMRVRFVEADDAAALADARDRGETVVEDDVVVGADEPPTRGGLRVVHPGGHALVEDLGRPGRSSLGVSRSGGMDHRAVREADRLVGMTSGAAVLELAGGGFEAVAEGDHVVALAGAPVPVVVRTPSGRRHEEVGAPFALDDGDVLSVGEPPSGVWTCLAVRGGLAVPAVLESASGDLRTGTGPGLLGPGDLVPVGTAWAEAVAAPAVDAQRSVPSADGVTVVDVVLGPRHDLVEPASLEALVDEAWRVAPGSDRTGLRLGGPTTLVTTCSAVLPREPLVPGGVEVAADGTLVVAMSDHPVTVSRPVVAVVVAGQLDRIAQVPVGGRVRFRVVPGPVLDGRREVAVDRDLDERGSEQ
ncbi:carboxyltransferase domain-containing protein [Frigoribacterium salinisoli]